MEQGTGRGRVSNTRFALGTVVGVLVGVLLVWGVLSQVRPNVPAVAATPTSSASVKMTAVTPSSSATSPDVTPTSAAPTTPTDARLAVPASNSWFAVAHWMPKSSTTLDKAVAYAASKSTAGRTLVVVDTDAVKFDGGKAGQYAVGLPGLASMDAATAACTAMALTPGAQCGRYRVL